MSDMTVLYYSARRIAEPFQRAVIAQLYAALAPETPIVTVAHGAPFDFGAVNLSVGDVPPSIYQVYRNILLGAQTATTPYVAMAEDDSLYVPEHFTYRPPLDTFAYNTHRYVLTRLRPTGAVFYYRQRTQMAQCLAPRQLLIDTLEERFRKFPAPVPHAVAKQGWGEPGRYEKNLGLTPRPLLTFRTELPNVTINHACGLMGRRAMRADDVICDDLRPWGAASDLWRCIVG